MTVFDVFNNTIADIGGKLYRTLIEHDRYLYLLGGLRNTLVITLFAALIGIAIGVIIAVVRSKRRTSPGGRAAYFITDLYLTLIRGTPVTVQLMIIYFLIFAPFNIDRVFVAIIAFGLNSGAYAAEIIRAGIMSVDKGQTEAGRSLGFSSVKTMRFIVMPQAIKNSVPAMCNEVISLLKETSVAGFIGCVDVTTAANYIRTATYDPFMPLILLAGIYLVLVLGLTAVVRRIEGRLRRGDSN